MKNKKRSNITKVSESLDKYLFSVVKIVVSDVALTSIPYNTRSPRLSEI